MSDLILDTDPRLELCLTTHSPPPHTPFSSLSFLIWRLFLCSSRFACLFILAFDTSPLLDTLLRSFFVRAVGGYRGVQLLQGGFLTLLVFFFLFLLLLLLLLENIMTQKVQCRDDDEDDDKDDDEDDDEDEDD